MRVSGLTRQASRTRNCALSTTTPRPLSIGPDLIADLESALANGPDSDDDLAPLLTSVDVGKVRGSSIATEICTRQATPNMRMFPNPMTTALGAISEGRSSW